MVYNRFQDLLETLVADSVELKAEGKELRLVLDEGAEFIDWFIVYFIVVEI